MVIELHIPGDHFQFYIEDETAHVDTSNIWDTVPEETSIVVAPGWIGVSTVRFGGIFNISINVLTDMPQLEYSQWDKIVACSIELHSSQIVIWSPENDFAQAPRIAVASGIYTCWICFAHINDVQDELAEDGDDSYHIFLWPGKHQAPLVLYRRL